MHHQKILVFINLTVGIVFDEESALTISVYDDGCGIDEKDAGQLFKRSFSSKCPGKFFGYKGEALHFLSRLSRLVEIESKLSGTAGFKLKFVNGESHITHHSSIATSGTHIKVQDPFHLAPVRRTEWIKRRPWHCSKVMDYIKFCSIVHPIRFHLRFSWKKDVSFVSVPHENIVDRVKYAAQTKTAEFITSSIENFDCSAVLIPNISSFKMVSLNHRQYSMNLCLENNLYGYFLMISSTNVHQFDCSAKGTNEGRGVFLPSLSAINHWINTAIGTPTVNMKTISRSTESSIQSNLNFSEIQFVNNYEAEANTLNIHDIECLQIVGQFNNGFIITISEQKTGCKLVIIDQHGADERGFYESFKFKRHGLSIQRLIQPHILNMDFEKIHALSRSKSALQQLGFEIEEDQFGAKLVTVPVIMGTACSAEGEGSYFTCRCLRHCCVGICC